MTNKRLNINTKSSWLVLALLFAGLSIQAQSITYFHRDIQRIGNTFESILFGDNQTVLVPLKGTAEMDIMHRFGVLKLKGGYSDLYGLYAPSNIRIGMGYVPITNLMLGFGLTKDRLLWDLNAKYALLSESQPNPDFMSLSYYVNWGIDTRDDDIFIKPYHRFSFFHQIMAAKKISRDFSIQGSASLSHFNIVYSRSNAEGELMPDRKHDHIAVGVMARYKISDAFAFMADITQPITRHDGGETYGNICLGFEIATPMHSFQMFFGNNRWMVPQYNNVFNQFNYNDFSAENTQFMLGFNITRLLDLQEESLYDMILKRHPKKEKGKDNEEIFL